MVWMVTCCAPAVGGLARRPRSAASGPRVRSLPSPHGSIKAVAVCPSSSRCHVTCDAVGFIGGGNMATSIISGLLYSNYCIPEEIMVAVRSPDSPKTTRLRYEEAKPPPWRGGGPPPSSPPTLHLYFLPVPYHHRDLGVTIVDVVV